MKTYTPEMTYEDLVRGFSDDLHDRLAKLKATPDDTAFAHMVRLSLYRSGLKVEPRVLTCTVDDLGRKPVLR